MAVGQTPDYTFEAFAGHDFYRAVNQHLVDGTWQKREELSPSPIRRVVDLACGTGSVTQLLVDRVLRLREPVDVVGLDPSESALEKARRLVGNAARFVRGTAQAVSDFVAGADIVLFCNAIHLVPDKTEVVASARKVLNPEGVFGFNTSFYEGCYSPGTEKFYKLWMLRALQILKQESGLRPDRQKTEAMRWLKPADYVEILEAQGFAVEDMHAEEAMITCKSWQDISHYSEFAKGALPGIPLDLAISALQRSVAKAYDELGIREIPRNWLQVVARAV